MAPAIPLPRNASVVDLVQRMPRYLRGLGFVRVDPTGLEPRWRLDDPARSRVEVWRARERAALDARVRDGLPVPSPEDARVRLAWATHGFLVDFFSFALPPVGREALSDSFAARVSRDEDVRGVLDTLGVYTNLSAPALVEAILRVPQ